MRRQGGANQPADAGDGLQRLSRSALPLPGRDFSSIADKCASTALNCSARSS